jgi:ribosome-binding ATPase
VVAICAKIEAELADMDDEDKAMFLAEMGQDEPGLNRLIRAASSCSACRPTSPPA